MCTADCVSRCGSLAELPRTEASQLVGCFEETCGCTNKWSDVSGNQERTEDQHIAYDADLMHQYLTNEKSIDLNQVHALNAKKVLIN